MSTGAGPTAFVVDGRTVARAEFDRVALDPARSVVIQACAGSGKTWLLVARLLRLLLAGAEPREILAITFTRKAAQEMQARLVELLEQLACAPDALALEILAARGLDAREAQALLPRARGLFEAVLTAVNPVTIETFHGWFARIVRGAPLVAGVPAGFGLVERTGELRLAARREFLVQVGQDARQKEAYLGLLRVAGEHAAWQLVWALIERRNEWQAFKGAAPLTEALERLAVQFGFETGAAQAAPPDARLELLGSTPFVEAMRAIAQVLVEGTAAECERATRTLELLEGVADAAGAPRAADFEEISRLVEKKKGGAVTPTRRAATAAVARLGPLGAEQLGAMMTHAADACAQARARARDQFAFELNRYVWTCAEAVLDEYTKLKRARGALDFNDLEWLAFSLSQDEAAAAYIQTRLDARYRHILVDEFQDTNPLQWITLESWLEAYGGDAQRPSVMLVGDPNQSIYRFRGAEPRLFDTASAFLAERYGASRLSTHETRRCAQAVITALNGSFESFAAPDFQPHLSCSPALGAVWRIPEEPAEAREQDQAEEAPPADQPGGDPVHLELRDALTTARLEKENGRVDAEAVSVAAAIRALVGTQVLEGDGHPGAASQVARYRDVLVLVRKRARMAPLERAFRAAGIPYSSDRAGGLLTTLEALDLSALLRFLVVPFSNHLLAHVLRSPLFAARDEDLVRLGRTAPASATWWQRLQDLAPHDPLAPAARQLARWVYLAGVRPVHDLLDRIYTEGAVIERYVSSVAPEASAGWCEQVRANLLAYLELALEMDSGRYPSLPRFIEELDALARGTEQESPDEGVADHGDTVRILTIHGAKGLEAPIVFLTDTSAQVERAGSNEVLIDWPAGTSAPSHVSIYGSVESRGSARASLFDQDAQLRTREDRNLLYVGVTRAKEILVFSGAPAARGDTAASWYARMSPFARLWPPEGGGGAPGFASDGHGVQPHAARPEMALIADFRPDRVTTGRRASTGRPAAESEEAARLRGIALHRILEFTAGAPTGRDALEGLARAQGLDAAAGAEVARQADAILAAPALSRFFDPKAYVSGANEVELVTAQGELLRIDRLVEFRDEIWVLDYKSRGSVSGIEPHREQLERYRSAVLGLAPGVPVRVGIIFADATLLEM